MTTPHLKLPKRLIIGTYDNLLALALYLVVGRLFVDTEGLPVPLSRGDVRAYDPTVTDGAYQRAVARLLKDGWLIELGGYKGTFLPSWGVKRGAASQGPYTSSEVHLWMVDAPLLGCPKHIAAEAIRIDYGLLDLFVGHLTTTRRFARVERLVTTPLLRLAEVGAYAAARGKCGDKIPAEAIHRLSQWGLWHEGQPVATIPSEQIVLAQVAQQAQEGGPTLTEAGWQRLNGQD